MRRYTAWCENEHRTFLTLDRLDETLQAGSCPKCWGSVLRTQPETIHVHCLDCRTQHDGPWCDIVSFFHAPCLTCTANSESEAGGRFHVVGSSAAEISDYEEMGVREDIQLEHRDARPDYWEFVIHFCEPDAFESIVKANRIVASLTGYFKTAAVCLTDAPIAFTGRIEEVFGECGFVFRKAILLEHGGGPAVYLAPDVLRAQVKAGFSDALKPFVNIVRPPALSTSYIRTHDWLHEREWRFPRDIEFDEIQPEGVVLPQGAGRFRRFGSPLVVMDAARRFGELDRGLRKVE